MSEPIKLPQMPPLSDAAPVYSRALRIWVHECAALIAQGGCVEVPEMPAQEDFDSYFFYKKSLRAWKRACCLD